MKKLSLMALAASVLFVFSGCEGKKAATESHTTYKHSTEEVYTTMCVKCHGKHGEGVKELGENGKPKGPAINDLEIYELKLAITDIKSDGLNQSSGTEHEVMEHNYKAIKKKGMDYDTDKMATYIYNNFNINK